MKLTLLTISILLSCLCGKGQTTIDTGKTYYLPFPNADQLFKMGFRKMPYPNGSDDPLAALQSQITHLQARVDSLGHELGNQKKINQFNTDVDNYYIKKVDSLIEAMRGKSGDPFKGAKINPNAGNYFDYTSDSVMKTGDIIPAYYEWPGRKSGYVNLPDEPTTGTLFSWGRNKGGVHAQSFSGGGIDSTVFTAYLIDVNAHTIAIDHRTKLPHVRPDHPVEGMLIKDKGRYEYFERGMWVKLKEVK